MTKSLEELVFPNPEPFGRLTNTDIVLGQPIPAIDRMNVLSPDDFENLVREWVVGYLKKKETYADCKKCSGAGDKGRDVIGKVDGVIWDNFQCKHYDHALAPSDVYIELGKLCYYTFINEFTLPRKYYFVSPKGIGAKLNLLLEKPEELKQSLFENWDGYCKNKIQSKNELSLTADLHTHIEGLDFSIFEGYDPQRLIDEHSQTPWHAARFGGGLLRRKQQAAKIPDAVQKHELVYTNQLFRAYSDFMKTALNKVEDLAPNEELSKHFNRQRVGFYSADALNQFSRDKLPPDSDYFADLMEEFYEGVVDKVNDDYKSGYDRVKATTDFAKTIVVEANPLAKELAMADRVGICHHLANEKRLQWLKEN